MQSDPTKKTGRVERRQAKKKQTILSITLRLIAEQGYDDTTMEQIAEEADIAKGTLYNYFPSKEAIISAYVQQTLKEDLTERLSKLGNLPDTRARVIYVFTELLAGVKRQKVIFEKFLIYRMQQMVHPQWRENPEQNDLYALSAGIIQLGQQQGEVRDDIPLLILQDLFEFVFVEIVKLFYLDSDAFDSESIIERCADLFLNGIQPRA